MATQTKTNKPPEAAFEEATDRMRDLSERVVESARKAGNATIDTYEKALVSVAEFEEKVGEASPIEFVSTLAHAQASLTRDLTKAYVAAARTLVN